jgi:hypothetical protein
MEAATKWAVHSAMSLVKSLMWWVQFMALLLGIAWAARTFAIEGRIVPMNGMAQADAGSHAPAMRADSASGKAGAIGPEDLLRQAEAHVRAGRWSDAEREFAGLMGRPAQTSRAELGLGVAMLALGRDAEAVTAFTAVQDRGESEWRASAFLGQALALRRIGDIQAAMIAWNLHLRLCASTEGHDWHEAISDSVLRAIYLGDHEPKSGNTDPLP